MGSAKLSDNALAEAAWIVGKMLDSRKDIVKAMIDNRVRVVFGRVTKGADVLRKMLASPVEGEKLKSPVDIRRVIRTE